MKPSLDGAYLRIDRANHHLEEIKIFQDNLPRPVVDREMGNIPLSYPHVATDNVTVSLAEQEVSAIVSILVGETVYNLRSALDYLVFELAFLDSGSIQNGTQFPIESSPQGWKRRLSPNRFGNPGKVQFLSVAHQAAIERLQPYNGVTWTKTLADISNPDKHRRLVGINPSLQNDAIMLNPKTGEMNVNPNLATLIAFDKGGLVVETLEILQSQVSHVLDSFKPEF
jgi:hypothetical protein